MSSDDEDDVAMVACRKVSDGPPLTMSQQSECCCLDCIPEDVEIRKPTKAQTEDVMRSLNRKRRNKNQQNNND